MQGKREKRGRGTRKGCGPCCAPSSPPPSPAIDRTAIRKRESLAFHKRGGFAQTGGGFAYDKSVGYAAESESEEEQAEEEQSAPPDLVSALVEVKEELEARSAMLEQLAHPLPPLPLIPSSPFAG